jgi:hypothetical protein
MLKPTDKVSFGLIVGLPVMCAIRGLENQWFVEQIDESSRAEVIPYCTFR